MDKNMVTIPEERYRELVSMEARLDIVVSYFVDNEDDEYKLPDLFKAAFEKEIIFVRSIKNLHVLTQKEADE